ncbi:MAG: hypothetical protein Q9217_003746 [Psora testacea]
MLRPATPLTILFFIAFVLLLLATISTPIVKAIPLASVNGVNLGVFGYCTPSGCSKMEIGYSVDSKTLFGDANENPDFSLPTSARSSLSSILIVHPIAALLTLVCAIMSAVAHLHSPSHSPRYLISILILSIPTLLVTLLAFLVDILLFVPHLAWGGWIVLASTIIILASGIVTCAMRRTLVSRKERKRRIAENAEMNGQNFYANQNQVPQGIRAESPPPLASGAIGQSDKLPTFATFEKTSPPEDDQIPLNRRTSSNKTLQSMSGSRGLAHSDNGSERYGAPARGGPRGMRGGRGGYGVPRDEYGNPLPPSNAFGPAPPLGTRRDRSEPPMRRQYSDEAFDSYGSRGRGRGGYPPRGYGGGGSYGPARGGHGRGLTGPSPNRGPPALGYGNGYPPQGRPGQYDGPGPGPAGYGRSPSAPGYGRRQYSPGPPSAPGGYGRQSPGPPSKGGYSRGPARGMPLDPEGYGYERQAPMQEPSMQQYNDPLPPMPPPMAHPEDISTIGQAVEMDARHGSPSMSPGPPFAKQPQLRDSDSDVQGFVGLQQQPRNRDSPMSIKSSYSLNEPYVPPRAAWKGNSTTLGVDPPSNSIAMNSVNPSSTANDPIELPVQSVICKPCSNTDPSANRNHTRNKSSDNYYEDVDPRFASPPPPNPTLNTHHPTHAMQQTQSNGTMPSSLMPGFPAIGHQPLEHQGEVIDPTSAYEDIPDGQRSPASDHSNMTSISQRGVNPYWQPGEQQGRLDVPGRRHVQQQRGMQLGSNPDFGLPARIEGIDLGRAVVPPPTEHGQAF